MKRKWFILSVLILAILIAVPAAYASTQAQLPDLPPISPELLAAVYAGILSLALTYIPGLNTKWAALGEDVKKLVMGAGLIAISVAVFAVGCAPALGIVFVECSTGGAVKLLSILISALIASQAIHRLTPMPASVKAAKAKG